METRKEQYDEYAYNYSEPYRFESNNVGYTETVYTGQRRKIREETRITENEKRRESAASRTGVAMFALISVLVIACTVAVLTYVLQAASISENYAQLTRINAEIEEKRASIAELNGEVEKRIASENFLAKVAEYEQKYIAGSDGMPS